MIDYDPIEILVLEYKLLREKKILPSVGTPEFRMQQIRNRLTVIGRGRMLPEEPTAPSAPPGHPQTEVWRNAITKRRYLGDQVKNKPSQDAE